MRYLLTHLEILLKSVAKHVILTDTLGDAAEGGQLPGLAHVEDATLGCGKARAVEI